MSLDFNHVEENGIKYLVHPPGSIFEGMMIRENPDDWMYMYSKNNKDYFKNYYTRNYKAYPQFDLGEKLKNKLFNRNTR